MSRFAIVALAALLSASVVCAQEAVDPTQAKQASSGSIVITSDTLRADGAKGTATFSGSVRAIGDELHMEADTMKVYYTEGGSDLERIEADGSVKLVREGRIVTSGRAVYDTLGRKMTFTENARVVEGGNVLVGTKITYMIDEDRYDVEGSKIFIENTSGAGGSR